MTVLGLILLLVWGYSVVSLAWELYTDTLEEGDLRFLISLAGLVILLMIGIEKGWFDFLSYKIF